MTSGANSDGGGFVARRHGAAYALLLLWCAVVWFLSSRPDPGDTLGFWIDLPDYVLHGVEFAAGGLLAAAAFSHLRPPLAVAAALSFCIAYGLLDEWHQSFVPGRFSDFGDVVADTVGAAIGILVFAWIARRMRVRGVLAESLPPSVDNGRSLSDNEPARQGGGRNTGSHT